MNLLVCSAGRRVKLVQYIKDELEKINGEVIAVDCDKFAPALQFAHHYEVVPKIYDPSYFDIIKSICHKYKITAILSLIDPELNLLAKWKDRLKEEGITAIISDERVVELTFDKYETYKFLKEHSFPYIPTYLTYDEVCAAIENEGLQFPLFVKPRTGSASIGLSIIHSLQELEAKLTNSTEQVIIQPFLSGKEYGIDCYIDLISNKITNIFVKEKLKMRAGETDKSIAVKNEQIVNLIKQFVYKLDARGPIDIDCIETEEGLFISEVNPRFGGGYIHAHEAGQDFVRNMIRNLQGIENDVQLNSYNEGSVLIKYDDCLFINK